MYVWDKKEDCCGCTACKIVCPKNAIEMKEDEEGFLYPNIDKEKCINCGLCKKICAFKNGYEKEDRLENIKVLACKAKDEDIRLQSSSGGMFTVIAESFLSEQGIVYGVAFDKNLEVKHIRISDKNDLSKIRGSKYVQSEIGSIFEDVKKDLENKKQVLFTGTPCQIAGLNKFLENVNKENLLLIDIICHGTPSPKQFKEYIQFIEKETKKKVTGYKGRSKTILTGIHTEEIIYEDGKTDCTSRLSQTWRRIYDTSLNIRPSCLNCKYTNLKRPSDITIGDFWGIENIDKDFYDKKGISLTILNTKKGEEFYKTIEDKVIAKENSIENAIKRQPQLQHPTKVDREERQQFWEVYKKHGIKKIASKYGKYNFIGKTKHVIKRYK